MSKAEERAFEYQMSIGPNVIGGAGLLSEDEFKKLNINHHFKAGYEQAEKDLGWHSVKEALPPMGEEVVVLTDSIHGKIVPDAHYICYGYIVDKNIAIDYDGWNIPCVTHWMYLPKI